MSTQTQYSLEDAERSGDETRLAEELRNAGPDVAPNVTRILKRTRSPRVRNAAALALADMRAVGARDSLIDALRRAETRGHRGTILYALDELGANLPLSLLADLIVHDPYEAREEALRFLASGRVDRDADTRQVERTLQAALRRADAERSHALREALEYLSEGIVLEGAAAMTAAGDIGVTRGIVLEGAAAFTAAGQIGVTPGAALQGAAAFAAAGEFRASAEVVARAVNLLVQAVIVPGARTDEGTLIEAVAVPWFDIIAFLKADPRIAFQISWEKWEEIIAGAYKKAGWDEVTLTPRSGDFGRDVIATKKGIGSVRVIEQVKAYTPPRLVTANDVRALVGVLELDGAAKGFLSTTSDFAPKIRTDLLLKKVIRRSRIQLINGPELFARLEELARGKTSSPV